MYVKKNKQYWEEVMKEYTQADAWLNSWVNIW
jgi:hypothetical protein